MHVIFNGKEVAFPDQSTVLQFLTQREIPSERVIFLCNDRIVPAEEYPSRILTDRDRVEVLNIVGGG